LEVEIRSSDSSS